MSLSSPVREKLNRSQIDDLRLAASKLSGAKRRCFQAEMSLKYCNGSARLTETVFGWSRETVELGLAERRTGMICVGAQSGFSGTKRWEQRYPEIANALRQVAESYAPPSPTTAPSSRHIRLTAAEALRQLKKRGFAPEQLPSPSTMAEVLNRMGYRLKKGHKAESAKKLPETQALFNTSHSQKEQVNGYSNQD